ncbi:MAG: VanZ family protein [Acidobacteriota bacterium]|nr:VanZ family protein [Acidobacteriota bacterium]
MRFVRTWLPVIVWSAVIFSASTDSFSSIESRGWLASIAGPEMAGALNIAIRKLGHVVVYAILGILAWRADRRMIVAIAIALIVAVTDETRQSMARLRTGSPWDVLLDGLSAWFGILVVTRMGMWRESRPSP